MRKFEEFSCRSSFYPSSSTAEESKRRCQNRAQNSCSAACQPQNARWRSEDARWRKPVPAGGIANGLVPVLSRTCCIRACRYDTLPPIMVYISQKFPARGAGCNHMQHVTSMRSLLCARLEVLNI